MEGPLSKWTNVMKGWQYRWFVLDESAGLFSYYTSKEKMLRGVRRGCVRLRGAVIGIEDEDDYNNEVDNNEISSGENHSGTRSRSNMFTITTVDAKTFHFHAQNSQERERWIRALEDTILRHNQISYYGHRRRLRLRGSNRNAGTSIKDFDRKLAETDRYLTIMLNQLEILNPEDDSEIIKDAEKMTEAIKHAIVLLQIAKNASLPNGGEGRDHETIKDLRKAVAVEIGVEMGVECKEDSQLDQKKSSQQPIPKAIPEFSYSSSDDEEDFYDAVDYDDSKNKGTNPKNDSDDNVDWELYDKVYEDDEDDNDKNADEMDMKSHGSVITHLLSQVRIGMDLTKIVLPTFILERRSLLEMYSDFFAHPDIFVEIVDGSTPEDRIISVLKWYLTSFHAGRKSAIAKKPYNPILGETFFCHWKLPNSNEKSTITNDLLPWCTDNDLVFAAEQVSHHPPVSAFYAEHKKKRISVNAHIYTKSSFLGMSIAVHNVGQGTVRLLDYGEEYIVTFPTGYGRSILTVPWIELGGKVSITCPQTHYSANIDFKCKQFFSSDVNKITAEVFAPNAKKSILKVDGEWNGLMMGKWSSGKNKVFVDVNKISIHRKLCKSLADQNPNESRRMWKDVTRYLKESDIDRATAAKFALEQKQREEAAARKEKNQTWETKLFKKCGDQWQFTNPLADRIVGN